MDTCGGIVSFRDKIKKKIKEGYHSFEEECNNMGSFEQRYDELKAFREKLSNYLYYNQGEGEYQPKITILKNGHVLDHHVLGYVAPMHFERTGFGGKKLSPVEQLVTVRNQLSKHGIRFIYVPLPCKLAVYPEIIGVDNILPKDKCIIPQWRNMLMELSKYDIEMADVYDDFIENKYPNCLFSRNHHVSPFGADVIAEVVSRYLLETTKIYDDAGFYTEREKVKDYVLRRSGDYSSERLGEEVFDVDCVYCSNVDNKKIFVGDIRSEIFCIGDCNLQSYIGFGCDIDAKISSKLKYPIYNAGRYLPFARYDSIDKMPENHLKGCKILIYIGFPSGSYVRAYNRNDVWSTSLIHENVF